MFVDLDVDGEVVDGDDARVPTGSFVLELDRGAG